MDTETCLQLQRAANRVPSPVKVACLVAVVTGPVGFAFYGSTGLAWGIGWGCSAALIFTACWDLRCGVIQGLSAGLFAGFGLGMFISVLGILPGLAIGTPLWGAATALIATTGRSPRASLGVFLARMLGAAFASATVGTIMTGVIGELLKGFSLSASGASIGFSLIAPVWAIGNALGAIFGYVTARVR
jgi:hypothetical protein